MQYNIAATFGNAKPKTIHNAAKADAVSLLLFHDINLPALPGRQAGAGMASLL